jgi:hypothetical protein
VRYYFEEGSTPTRQTVAVVVRSQSAVGRSAESQVAEGRLLEGTDIKSKDVGTISRHAGDMSSLTIFNPHRTVGRLTSLDGRDANDKIGVPGGGVQSVCQDGRVTLKNLLPGSFGMVSTSGYRDGESFFRSLYCVNNGPPDPYRRPSSLNLGESPTMTVFATVKLGYSGPHLPAQLPIYLNH